MDSFLAIISNFVDTFKLFFDGSMWIEVLSDPSNWGIIFSLMILEGLLSADNAMVLALLVSHLPPHQRKKALLYGFAGAVLFRAFFIGLGTTLVKLWWVKVLGAGYLLYLGVIYFAEKYASRYQDKLDFLFKLSALGFIVWLVPNMIIKGIIVVGMIYYVWIFIKDHRAQLEEENEEEEDTVKRIGFLEKTFGVFWGTVIQVELMDVAFSADSVLAAFGVSDKIWVLLGGILGILMMRGVAGVFTKLIEKVPEFSNTAYVLVIFIGIISVLGVHISHYAFMVFLVASFVVTYIIHVMRNNKKKEEVV